MSKQYTFGNASRSRLVGVNPKLVELMERSLEKSPIDFGIPQYGGVRSAEDQNQLYKMGKSKCDGYETKSYHQTGNAVDVYAYVNGSASWSDVHLGIIAGVVLSEAKEMGLSIRWGGTFGSSEFNGWDKPHFELRD